MRKRLIYAISFCEALGSLQIDIAPPTKLACVRYCLMLTDFYFKIRKTITTSINFPNIQRWKICIISFLNLLIHKYNIV